MNYWRILLLLPLIMSLTACGWSNDKYAKEAYLRAKEFPALKLPKQLAKHAEITPLYEIPKISKRAAKAGEGKLDLQPPRLVKAPEAS